MQRGLFAGTSFIIKGNRPEFKCTSPPSHSLHVWTGFFSSPQSLKERSKECMSISMVKREMMAQLKIFMHSTALLACCAEQARTGLPSSNSHSDQWHLLPGKGIGD